MSDHNSVFTFMNRSLTREAQRKKTIFDRNVDYVKAKVAMAQTLNMFDWEAMSSDDLLHFLTSIVREVISFSTEVKECRVKPSYVDERIDPELLRL